MEMSGGWHTVIVTAHLNKSIESILFEFGGSSEGCDRVGCEALWLHNPQKP